MNPKGASWGSGHVPQSSSAPDSFPLPRGTLRGSGVCCTEVGLGAAGRKGEATPALVLGALGSADPKQNRLAPGTGFISVERGACGGGTAGHGSICPCQAPCPSDKTSRGPTATLEIAIGSQMEWLTQEQGRGTQDVRAGGLARHRVAPGAQAAQAPLRPRWAQPGHSLGTAWAQPGPAVLLKPAEPPRLCSSVISLGLLPGAAGVQQGPAAQSRSQRPALEDLPRATVPQRPQLPLPRVGGQLES